MTERREYVKLRRKNTEARVGLIVGAALMLAAALLFLGAGLTGGDVGHAWFILIVFIPGAVTFLMSVGVSTGWSNYEEYLLKQQREDENASLPDDPTLRKVP